MLSVRHYGIQPRELTQLLATQSLRIGVQAEQDTLVDKWVLLLRPGTLEDLRLCRAHHRLDLLAVNEASDIRICHLRSG